MFTALAHQINIIYTVLLYTLITPVNCTIVLVVLCSMHQIITGEPTLMYLLGYYLRIISRVRSLFSASAEPTLPPSTSGGAPRTPGNPNLDCTLFAGCGCRSYRSSFAPVEVVVPLKEAGVSYTAPVEVVDVGAEEVGAPDGCELDCGIPIPSILAEDSSESDEAVEPEVHVDDKVVELEAPLTLRDSSFVPCDDIVSSSLVSADTLSDVALVEDTDACSRDTSLSDIRSDDNISLSAESAPLFEVSDFSFLYENDIEMSSHQGSVSEEACFSDSLSGGRCTPTELMSLGEEDRWATSDMSLVGTGVSLYYHEEDMEFSFAGFSSLAVEYPVGDTNESVAFFGTEDADSHSAAVSFFLERMPRNSSSASNDIASEVEATDMEYVDDIPFFLSGGESCDSNIADSVTGFASPFDNEEGTDSGASSFFGVGSLLDDSVPLEQVASTPLKRYTRASIFEYDNSDEEEED